MVEKQKLLEEMTRLNSEMANLQRKLAAQNAELQRLSDLKNQFLGTAAHDLRSPLSVVTGFCDLMLSGIGGNLTEEQTTFIKMIRKKSAFMRELVSDLLDISAIESGKLHFRYQETDFLSFLQENLALNGFVAQQKDIRIRFCRSGKLGKVKVDVTKIEQVMNNLLSNAIKFSARGSQLEVRAVAQSSNLLVSVKDQGPGISKADQKLLFQPFHQCKGTGVMNEKGTGLGLYIAKKVIEGHGGRIWVKSEVGQGAVFSFRIPIAPHTGQEGF